MFSKIIQDNQSNLYFLTDANNVMILALESVVGFFTKANDLFMNDLKDILELLDINVIQVFEHYSQKKFDAEFQTDLTFGDYLIYMQKVVYDSFYADDSSHTDIYLTFYNKRQLFEEIFDDEDFENFTDVHFKYIRDEINNIKKDKKFIASQEPVSTSDDF